jgi:hypothetical protein
MPPKKTKQTAIRPPDTQHPSPFSKAPTSLSPFLAQLDPAQVYITHIDRTQLHVKQQVFFSALLLNASIAGLLVWRAYAAIPKYLALTQTFLGYDSSAKVGDAEPTGDKVWILLSRTAMMLFDYLLVRLVIPWPGSFFFERPANPVTWRWSIGFQKEEVVARVCRNWEGRDMMKGEKKGEESPFFKTRILTAIDSEVMEKTGYLMMDGSWDLDFGAMQDAHTLLKQTRLSFGELDALVLVHQDAGGYKGWLGWRFRQPKGETAEGERRRKLVAFRELLASKGKESLFWRWQEVVEDERSADGTFTVEAQERVSKRVEEVFAKEGIDFKEAMERVGQVEALPSGPR